MRNICATSIRTLLQCMSLQLAQSCRLRRCSVTLICAVLLDFCRVFQSQI